MMLISASYMANIFSIFGMIFICLYVFSPHKARIMTFVTIYVCLQITIQYALALSNLSDKSSPQPFPPPYEGYPMPGQTRFPIPWYDSSENLGRWTSWLAIGVNIAKTRGVWFDFFNLVLLSIYFTQFCDPLYNQEEELDISWSDSPKMVDVFSRYFYTIMPRFDPKNQTKELTAQDKQDEKDEREEVLEDLKHQVFMFKFVANGRTIFMLSSHIICLVMVLVLGFMTKSFFSIGYIVMGIHCMLMTPYFFAQKVRKRYSKRPIWQMPRIVHDYLLPYAFIDILLQFLFQIPFAFLHEGQQTEGSWQQWLELHEVWLYSPPDNFTFNGEAVQFIIMKCVILFFVALQDRIFSSQTYIKFITEKLPRHVGMSKSKAECQTYLSNNKKIRMIIVSNYNKKKMWELVAKANTALNKWHSMFTDKVNIKTGLLQAQAVQPAQAVKPEEDKKELGGDALS